MRNFFKILLIIFVLLLYNTSFSKNVNSSVDQLVSCAIECFEKKHYKESIKLFTELREKYPFSGYDSLAFLKIADAYFELGEYLDAVQMYSDFEVLYPCDNGMPYALYFLASAYFKEVNHLGTDQKYIIKALQKYIKISEVFSDSNYAYLSKANIFHCYKKIVGYQFKIGVYYYTRKDFISAISRFLQIISFYPDVGYHKKVLIYIVECDQYILNNRLKELN